ncbi:hypothetical protein T4C_12470 [Trichinella pseudospiralis]|uniref:Uncharacterized protein n=1 Tax=Trichinella pseudospiralis TaxID=6337 RepID=A0A0V1JQ34_TRIPS|nr:hypothetical protein T4C_12470 [Trichinella pseudospiralis]
MERLLSSLPSILPTRVQTRVPPAGRLPHRRPAQRRRRTHEARSASRGPAVWGPGPGEAGRGGGPPVHSSTRAKVSRRRLEVVRPSLDLAPIATGIEFLPAPGTVLGIRSDRRSLTRRSTVAASCPLPQSGSFPGSRTSGSLRHAPNKFLTFSRAGLLPLSWSSPLGGLGGRPVHCWPTCAAGIHRKQARTTTGPLRSELPPRSRKKWPNRPYTCDLTLLQPLGAWTHNSAWRAIALSPWPGRVNKSVQNKPG